MEIVEYCSFLAANKNDFSVKGGLLKVFEKQLLSKGS